MEPGTKLPSSETGSKVSAWMCSTDTGHSHKNKHLSIVSSLYSMLVSWVYLSDIPVYHLNPTGA